MHAPRYLMLIVALGGSVTLLSCKDVSDDISGLSTDAGNKTVDASGKEQFNLAEWVAKKGIGGANMKNNIKAGNAYLFFNSNEEQNPNKENAAEAKKSKNKASLLKPEYELRMNATVVSDAKKAEVKSLFWVDGSLNGNKVFAGGNAVEASMLGSAKSGISVKGSLKAFGKDLVSQAVTLVKPFKITKTVDLEHKQTILGIPKIAGVEAGVTFVANATISGETDYLDKESVSMTMVPSAKVTAGIQGTVKAVLFASATAQGTVTVIDTKLPSSATLGGRVGSGADFLYGNVTFESATFKALNGELTIGAKAKIKGQLPANVEPALWSLTSKISPGLTKKLAAGWEWAYVVWDAPPFVNVKFPTFYTNSFLQSKSSKAACALPSITKVVASVTKENAKDTPETKKVGKDAISGLQTILAKAKPIKGTCAGAAGAKPGAAGKGAKPAGKTPAKK